MSPVGDTIASIDASGRVIIWNQGRRQNAGIDAGPLNRPPDGGWDQVRDYAGYAMSFSADGARLAILGPGNLSMWSVSGTKVLWNLPIDPDGALELGPDRVLTVVCDERGRGVTLGSLRRCYDSTARLWDFNGQEISCSLWVRVMKRSSWVHSSIHGALA